MAVPDVIRSILVRSELRSAALNVWSVPPTILYLNSACLPSGSVIALLKVMVMTVPAALVCADKAVGAAGGVT